MSRHLAAIALAALLAAAPAAAEEPPRRPITAGGEVDLVPIGITLATRDSGFAAALWVGRWKDRLRLGTSIVHEPETTKAAAPEPTGGTVYRRYEATRVSLWYDRFLRTEFQGLWAGAGVEVGFVSLGSDSRLTHANQVNPGAALAVGWNLPVWRGLYVAPSASLHAAIAPSVTLEGVRRREHAVWGVLSLSVGWAERTP